MYAKLGLPSVFEKLISMGCAMPEHVRHTADGCFVLTVCLARLLTARGIASVPGATADLPCEAFFDDWYLYAVSHEDSHIYSLFKMREQEYDKENGLFADGDVPGVTVSFIAFDTDTLLAALELADSGSLQAFNQALGQTVSDPGQLHHNVLRNYFRTPTAQAPYLMAKLYVRHVAGFAADGRLPVSKCHAQDPSARISRFLSANNDRAGHTVCDGQFIYIRDPAAMTLHEQYAILATHTANTDYHSFAAEVRFHAMWLLKPIRALLRPVYESAVRADMTIDDAELVGPKPYYHGRSFLIRAQKKYHGTL